MSRHTRASSAAQRRQRVTAARVRTGSARRRASPGGSPGGDARRRSAPRDRVYAPAPAPAGAWVPAHAPRDVAAGLFWLPRLLDKGRRARAGEAAGRDLLGDDRFGVNDPVDAQLLGVLGPDNAWSPSADGQPRGRLRMETPAAAGWRAAMMGHHRAAGGARGAGGAGLGSRWQEAPSC